MSWYRVHRENKSLPNSIFLALFSSWRSLIFLRRAFYDCIFSPRTGNGNDENDVPFFCVCVCVVSFNFILVFNFRIQFGCIVSFSCTRVVCDVKPVYGISSLLLRAELSNELRVGVSSVNMQISKCSASDAKNPPLHSQKQSWNSHAVYHQIVEKAVNVKAGRNKSKAYCGITHVYYAVAKAVYEFNYSHLLFYHDEKCQQTMQNKYRSLSLSAYELP